MYRKTGYGGCGSFGVTAVTPNFTSHMQKGSKRRLFFESVKLAPALQGRSINQTSPFSAEEVGSPVTSERCILTEINFTIIDHKIGSIPGKHSEWQGIKLLANYDPVPPP